MKSSQTRSLPFLASVGYGVGGIFSTIALYLFMMLFWDWNGPEIIAILLFLLALVPMGAIGGYMLGSFFKDRRKRLQLTLYSSLAALLITLVSILFNFKDISTMTKLYLLLAGGPFLIALIFGGIFTQKLKKTLIFGLYGLVAGIIGAAFIIALMNFGVNPWFGKFGYYLYCFILPLYGFCTGGLLGYFLERGVKDMV